MLPLDTIYNEDCLQGMRRMGDGTVDCIVCDPPYLLENRGGGFWSKNEDPTVNAAIEREQGEDFFSLAEPMEQREPCELAQTWPSRDRGGRSQREQGRPKANHYNARGTRKGMDRLGAIKDGITEEVLDEMCRVMKRVNIYILCSQRQIQQYLDYFVTRRRCNWMECFNGLNV